MKTRKEILASYFQNEAYSHRKEMEKWAKMLKDKETHPIRCFLIGGYPSKKILRSNRDVRRALAEAFYYTARVMMGIQE